MCVYHTNIFNMGGKHLMGYWPHWQSAIVYFLFSFSIVTLWQINMMMMMMINMALFGVISELKRDIDRQSRFLPRDAMHSADYVVA